MPKLGLRLTPYGRLLAENQDDAPDIPEASSARLNEAFERGSGYGLVWLGVVGVGQGLPPGFAWWRDFAASEIGSLCLQADSNSVQARQSSPS